MFKAESINQFLCWEFVRNNFDLAKVTCEIVSRDDLRVTDEYGESIILNYNEATGDVTH